MTEIVNVCTRLPNISAVLAKRIGLWMVRNAIHKVFFSSQIKKNSKKRVLFSIDLGLRHTESGTDIMAKEMHRL